MTYDIIIIGAGPAGSTAAALLAQAGRRVLLLEKSRFPREKLCGEFITPECLRVFARLGVRAQMLAAGAHAIRHWTIFAPDGRSLEVPLRWLTNNDEHALGLSRARMDTILLARARELGVEVREGCHVAPRLQHADGCSLIEAKDENGAPATFAAPVILDASGRNGVFSKQTERQPSRFAGARLFGCKVHLRGVLGLRERGEMFFFRDGYGGLCDIEDGRTNLCFITTEATLRAAKGDRAKLLELTLHTNEAARARLQNIETASEWLGTGPLTYGRQRSLPGVLAIGDAGAFIDPFTGSGMLLALSSGVLVAEVINESFAAGVRDIATITARYEQLHRAQFGWRFKACAMWRSAAFHPFARNTLVTVLARQQWLLRLAARSTRQGGLVSKPLADGH
jgi:menaquinone-9 beta-reductase